MPTLRIADSIAFELRFLGLIGAFEYDKYTISFIASAQYVLLMGFMGIQHSISLLYLDTIGQLTDLLYVFAIYIFTCSKLSGLVLNRDKVSSILDGLNEKEMFPVNWNCLHRNGFVKAMKHVRTSSRSFTFVIYVAVFVTITTTMLNRKLIFFCYFPFETRHEYSLQGYWLAYSYQVFYCLYLIQSNISLDIVTSAMMHCCAVKLEVLRHECEKLCSSFKCADNFNAIRTAVVFHIDTIGLIKDIERISDFGLFVQCFLSAFSISIVMLRVILIDIFTETEQLLGVVIVLLAFISQVFYYCHYGNQIHHQSTQLFTAIYLSKWYKLKCTCLSNGYHQPKQNHSLAIRRSIFIMLERTKRPTIVTAGHFIKLTYESYIMICRMGYQSFAVFRDVLK